MAQHWYLVRDGKEEGPITDQQLKEMATSGQIRPADFLRPEDTTTTIQAQTVKGLFPDAPRDSLSVTSSDAISAANAISSGPGSGGLAPSDAGSKPTSVAAAWRRIPPTAKIGIGVGGTCCVLLFVCCGGLSHLVGTGGADAVGDPGPPSAVVRAADLFQEYKDDEAAADQKYKGKTIDVVGVVASAGKDVLSTRYVTLEVSKNRSESFSLQCFFSDKDANTAANVKRGDWVKIRGRCEGKPGNIVLKHCEFD
jgi:hypothetical protein